ncbi:2-oxo-4-hydroxy-4-carboxy-5-ureidoimidazoline decarboxylase [Azospirillum sp. B4]|uniref:2-oxo-4-hydroxy-4-carboxy-5-ureidoimidazoline decarboxylase n=1 Tax=Azospirillum sp. B4 TaxID=95605 RepID=UPI00034762FF|nr:2-oxo-4-hydroxy-4-carboxy-5-ureidoimidazoline decarboxylase [Azospirillum sp. B4]
MNDTYKARFGFPFILAVRGLTRTAILENFEARVANDAETEFATATAQVERIALLRLREMLP